MRKIIPILLVINNSLFIISLAISFVILFRPFYYWHINLLEIPSETGYTYNEIKESYDDVMDYLVLNKPFSTGKLKYSLVGKEHFEDCKRLFIINFIILGISSLIMIVKRKYFNKIKLFHHNISYWSGITNLFVFISTFIVSIILGFDKIFEIFHNVFFLGKTNWLFDRVEDEIIKILPQQFFMNCAILILVIICILSILNIVLELWKRKDLKNEKKC